MRGALLPAALVAVSTLPSLAAHAQCAEGRVVGPETAGRCCWPGQSWDDARGRCEGPPSSCPEGWGAAGDECVRTAAPDILADPTVPTPPASGGGASDARTGGYTGPWREAQPYESPRRTPAWEGRVLRLESRRTEPLMGLMHTGLMLLSIGYGASMGFAIGWSTQWVSSTAWPYGFVPLVGGFIWGGVDLGRCCTAAGAFMGIPASGVQVLGLLLAIIGGAARRPVYNEPPTRRWGELGPRVVPGPGQVGLGLEWTL